MANPFINSSFTLRPSTNNRDRPELTLRQTEVSRIPRETTAIGNCSKGGRAFKRQRLFMDRPLSTTIGRGFQFDRNDDFYHANEDQYITDDEYDTPIIRRRVSSEFSSHLRISTRSSISESNYWKTRCIGMQNFCDESKSRLQEAEEDQRQLRQRIRELEEQLLIQTSRSNPNRSGTDKNMDTDCDAKGKTCMGEMNCDDKKTRAPPALVVEIKENHQAVSSCFYLTDGEGLNESYDLEMEDEEDNSVNIVYGDGLLHDIDDDRNDISRNQQRG